MAYTLATKEQREEMIKRFTAFEQAANSLTDGWLNFPSQGDAFMKDYPLTDGAGTSFCDFVSLVRVWVEKSVNDLQQEHKPLSFEEFRKNRTCYIPEQYEEIYGEGTILRDDHNDIGLVYTYEGGLQICAMRDGKFWLIIESSDYLHLDLLSLERKLYEFYLCEYEGNKAV